MLLDGSMPDEPEKIALMSRLIEDAFGVKDPINLSTYTEGTVKISDLPSLLLLRLQKEKEYFTPHGRIGPKEVRFHRHKPVLREGIETPDGVDLCSVTTFASMRTNTCVFEGKWMFEATLGTAGIQQIGWGTLTCPFTDEVGVGDAEDSYAYDGKRQKKWSMVPGEYGEPWAIGDVIGSCIDLESNTIIFYRNGKSLGVAFDSVKSKEEGMAYFPTVSLSFGEKCFMNYGAFPFQYPVDGYQPLQHGGITTFQQSEYLCHCMEKLLPYLNKLRPGEIQSTKEPQESQITFDDILILFANIFEVFIPLLTETRASHTAFVALLRRIDQISLVHLFHVIKICFTGDEITLFLSKLIWEISYRARITPWTGENTGSTEYLRLFLALVKIEFVAEFLGSNEKLFFDFLEEGLDIKLPNVHDMKEMFPIEDTMAPDISCSTRNTLQMKLQENQQAIMDLFSYLLPIENGPLANKVRKWIILVIQKNKGMFRNLRIANTTNSTVLFNIFSSLLGYLSEFLLSTDSFLGDGANFLANSKHYVADYTRVGGTFTHVQQKYPFTIPENHKVDLQVEVFEYVLLLCISGVGKALQQAGNRLAAYTETNKQMHDVANQPVSLMSAMAAKRESQARICFWDECFWLRSNVITNMWNLINQIAALIHHLQQTDSPLFKYLPEFYFEVMCDVLYFIRRGTNPKFDYAALEHRERFNTFISVLVDNISNPAIITTDLNDKMLVLLTNLCQNTDFLQLLAVNETAREKFIPSLISAFGTGHFWLFVCDILIVFWKGQMFGKRKKPSHYEYSVVFQQEFTKAAVEDESKMNEFINKLYNNLSSVITEFRVAIKELNDSLLLDDKNTKKKSALMFDLSCKLLKLLEIMSLSCPQVFLQNELNMVRLSELILAALSTIDNNGPYAAMFTNFLRKVTKRGVEGATHFKYGIYGPVAGILVSLYEQENRKNKIEEILGKVDGASDPSLFLTLLDFSWSNAKQTCEQGLLVDIPRIQKVVQILEQQYASRTTIETDDDDDNICTICYSNQIDTLFVPCCHRSCKQCISRHLLNNKNCFFCNAEIQKTETLKPLDVSLTNISIENLNTSSSAVQEEEGQ